MGPVKLPLHGLNAYNEEPMEEKNNFTDVPENEWYTEAVAWAAENKIVNGVGNNCFAI